MKKLTWKWFDHRTDVPRWLAAGVGQIAIEFSLLERELEETIRLLMDINIRFGRTVTTGMNVRTRLLVAANLVQGLAYHDVLPVQLHKDFVKLGDKIEQAESDRNKFIHGLWGKQEGVWRVLRTTAARPVPSLRPDFKRLARSVLPQSEPVTRKTLDSVESEIIRLSKEIEAFCGRVHAALAPLQHKVPRYTRKRR